MNHRENVSTRETRESAHCSFASEEATCTGGDWREGKPPYPGTTYAVTVIDSPAAQTKKYHMGIWRNRHT
jgi:hypothetical protein